MIPPPEAVVSSGLDTLAKTKFLSTIVTSVELTVVVLPLSCMLPETVKLPSKVIELAAKFPEESLFTTVSGILVVAPIPTFEAAVV